MRVQITKMPLDKAAYGKQVQGSLSLKPGAFGGADYKPSDDKYYKGVKDTIGAVPRDEANLEAEGGETAFGPISGQSIPDHLKIVGKRHTQGGVPLNLPDDTFIFSDTASLRINEPAVLAMFNKVPKKGGYTPAEIAKPYNINKYKAILLDPESSKLERDTATIMIKNYIMKLGSLALVQESMKGFPQGIPAMAKPYMEANGISEEDLMPELKEQAEALAQATSQGMPQGQNPMAQQEMQQMNPEQAMQNDQAMMQQGEQQFPEQMPSGAPVATPESIQQRPPQGMMPPPDMMQQPPMAFGGIPYGAYGIEMGTFYDNPNEMAYGGVPKFGGPGDSQVTVNKIKSKQVGSLSTGTGWNKGQSSVGTEGQWRRRQGESVAWATGPNRGGGNEKSVAAGVCAKIKKSGSVENAIVNAFPAYLKWEGWTGPAGGPVDPNDAAAKQAYDAAMAKAVAKLAANPDYAECIKQANTDFTEAEHVLAGETPKDCPCKDEQGNVIEGMFAKQDENGECLPETCGTTTETVTLKCRCVDPVTGAEKTFPIEKEEECVCQDGSQGQVAMGDTPHWSVPAKRDIMANLMMKTDPAPSNVVLPGNAQMQGAYEEYQTKVDTAQSAVNGLQNAVMNSMAGSTAAKQSQMKDLLGKSLRASMDAVANVQSRNVDRQRETNTQQAALDKDNADARAATINQGLSMQANNQNMETVAQNKKIMNTAKSMNAADAVMQHMQNLGTTTPQYAPEYDYGFIYPTGVEKPLTGATGPNIDALVRKHTEKGVPYEKAYNMALRELSGKKHGGYVFGTNAFPFLL